MNKDKKSRSGSISNGERQDAGHRKQQNQPGAPEKSNRQTGGSKRQERDESSGSDRNTSKKAENAI